MFMPSGIAAASSAGGEDEYTVNAGSGFGIVGYQIQNPGGTVGNIQPDFNFKGGEFTIPGVYTLGNAFLHLELLPQGSANDDSVFKAMELSGTFSNGVQTFLVFRADAVYTSDIGDDGRSQWEWPSLGSAMVSPNAYAMRLIY